MDFVHITSDHELSVLCGHWQGAPWLAFDTEFVSENRYRPQLCLIQVATESELTLIDTLSVKDLLPFWELIATGVGTPIVHAAREEFLFCLRGLGRTPPILFDVQLAAGFVGQDFPASLGTLVGRLLDEPINKAETRTDWRARPLSKKQIHYALQDIQYLERIYRILQRELDSLGRTTWFQEEQTRRQHDWETTDKELQWTRLQGISKLNPRSLAIARQLFLWRDREARQHERMPRRILPDDLLVEIAKRGEADVPKLRDIRGLNHRLNARYLPHISEQVRIALRLPEDELPSQPERAPNLQLGLLGQFLTTGLALVCAEQRLSPGLVATAQDVRELAAWRLGLLKSQTTPILLEGWRNEVAGKWVDQMIQGKLGLRVLDPNSEHPIGLVEL